MPTPADVYISHTHSPRIVQAQMLDRQDTLIAQHVFMKMKAHHVEVTL
jgi:hypothetical protein